MVLGAVTQSAMLVFGGWAGVKGAFVILVTGATGNVGAAAVDWLCQRGVPVRSGMRAPPRRGPEGIEVVRFDWTDPLTWKEALAGVRGCVLVRPPAIADVASTLCRFSTLAAQLGCKKISFLSVMGVESKSWTPHHKVEHHLRQSGLSWTFLRAGFFAQNLLDSYLPDIGRGEIRVPAGSGKVAWVDARDVGEAAARVLMDDIWDQRTPVLTGPEAIGFHEVSHQLSQAIGTQVAYKPCSVAGYLLHLKWRHRLPLIQCVVQTVLHYGLRNGDAAEVRDDLRMVLGRTPRTLGAFLEDHPQAFSSR